MSQCLQNKQTVALANDFIKLKAILTKSQAVFRPLASGLPKSDKLLFRRAGQMKDWKTDPSVQLTLSESDTAAYWVLLETQ